MIVVWRVTENCNLSCAFCAYDRRLARERNTALPSQILRFGARLAAEQSRSGRRILVSWLGGEPLLWSPMEKLTEIFCQEYGLSVSTTTNGTSLGSPKVVAHLVRYYSEVTLSVDGLGSTHDKLRGSSGLFERVRLGARALAERITAEGCDLKLRANVVLFRSTVDSFSELCFELATWGIREISFNALGGRDRPEFFPGNRLLPDQIARFAAGIPLLRRRLGDCGVRLLGSADYLDRLVASASNEARAIRDCHPGETFLFVDERGRASPCSFTSDEYGVGIDRLCQMNDLSSLPELFHTARKNSPSLACEDCLSTHVFTKFLPAHG